MMKRHLRKLSLLLPFFLVACNEATGVLNPKGIITFQERQLLFDALALMLIVVIPVIIMSFAFIYRYHHKRSGKDYRPNWSHNTFLEVIWWGVPCVIVVILGIMTWHMSHKLDPYRRIDVPGKPLEVNVVALPWNWLFIYPEQNIATLNTLTIPKDRQVEFFLTSDNVPMSAFFIPQLGSQIYTMAGMRTRLHLVGTELGNFKSLNSQYNGDGFSDMHFITHVVTDEDFAKWVTKIKQSTQKLDNEQYRNLREPKIAAPMQVFAGVKPGLFTQIIQSYHSAEHPTWESATTVE